MAQETYLTPEQAAKAFVEGANHLRNVQLLHLDSKDQWAAAEVTGVNDDGTWTHRVFLQHAGTGWTVRGGCGAPGGLRRRLGAYP